MSPIRVGIVGLSKSGWASISTAPALLKTNEFVIAAVSTSSQGSAEASAAKQSEAQNGLNVKAYHGNTSSIAQDPDLDIVAVSVASHGHFAAAKPILEAGKNIFIEWPAGANLKETEELAALAKAKGVRSLVGLQGRHNPVIQKAREIVDSGKLGKILSVTLLGSAPKEAGYWGGWVKNGSKRTLDPAIGSSFLEIIGGHLLGPFFQAIGSTPESLSATSTIQFEKATIVDDQTSQPTGEELKNTLPDHIAFNGLLKNGALFSVIFRAGQPYATKGRKQFMLLIEGTEGSVKLESDSPHPAPHIGDPELYVNGEKLTVDDIGGFTVNIQNLWKAYAKGEEGSYPTLEDAVALRKLFEDIERSSREGVKVQC